MEAMWLIPLILDLGIRLVSVVPRFPPRYPLDMKLNGHQI